MSINKGLKLLGALAFAGTLVGGYSVHAQTANETTAATSSTSSSRGVDGQQFGTTADIQGDVDHHPGRGGGGRPGPRPPYPHPHPHPPGPYPIPVPVPVPGGLLQCGAIDGYGRQWSSQGYSAIQTQQQAMDQCYLQSNYICRSTGCFYL